MCEYEDDSAFRLDDLDDFNVDVIKMAMRRAVRYEDYKDLKVEYNINAVRESADIIVLQLFAYVTGKVVDKIHIDIEYPSNWWEAFKDRWFPEWMLRRWPVKFTRIKVNEERFLVCPHLAVEPRINHYRWLKTADINSVS